LSIQKELIYKYNRVLELQLEHLELLKEAFGKLSDRIDRLKKEVEELSNPA